MATPKRQWLIPKSDSLESFVFFVIRAFVALIVTVAVARWALTGDVSQTALPAGAVVAAAAGVAGGITRSQRDGKPPDDGPTA